MMGLFAGKLLSFVLMLSVLYLNIYNICPAVSKSLLASSTHNNIPSQINGLRIGSHPDKTRIVIDVSHPTNVEYKISSSGKILTLNLPKAHWIGENSPKKFFAGQIINIRHTPAGPYGTKLIIESNSRIKVEKPFFVPPDNIRGYRIVFDMVPSNTRGKTISDSRMVASLDGSGALPRRKIQIAQMATSNNPYIQRAFPNSNQNTNQSIKRDGKIKNQPRRHEPSHQNRPPHWRNVNQYPVQNKRVLPYQKHVVPPQENDNFLGLSNPYIRGSTGLSFFNEQKFDGGLNNFDAEYSPGFLLTGAFGSRLENGISIEGELSYTNATLKQISGLAINPDKEQSTYNTENVGGDMSAMAIMGNVKYDISTNSRLTPYVEAGVGIAGLWLNDIAIGHQVIVDDMDWVFASQLGFGVSFDLDDRTKIAVGYRYFESQDPEFADFTAVPFESIFSNHNFLIGANIDLN